MDLSTWRRRIYEVGWTERESGCWDWNGAPNSWGYGHLMIEGRIVGAHRATYTVLIGPIPEGLFLLHSCDRPVCVNPAHLRPGTQADNMRDKVERGRSVQAHSFPVGPEHPRAKLTEESVLQIRLRLQEGLSLGRLASEYGITKQAVASIRDRKTWAWLPE